MEKSKHLQDQLKELKTEIESLKLEEQQQQQAGVYSLLNEARGYPPEPAYQPHSNVRIISFVFKIKRFFYRRCCCTTTFWFDGPQPARSRKYNKKIRDDKNVHIKKNTDKNVHIKIHEE